MVPYETIAFPIIKGNHQGRLSHNSLFGDGSYRVSPNGFSRSLDTNAMSEFVTRHFL